MRKPPGRAIPDGQCFLDDHHRVQRFHRTAEHPNHPQAVAPAYAILVQRSDGHWRRQVYLSLHAATKAMARAEANGGEARCVLVELVPVPAAPVVVVGGGAA